MKTVIISHSADLDGAMSGQIVFNNIEGDKVTVGYDYGEDQESIMNMIDDGDVVYMTDVSFTRNNMEKILDMTKRFVWIDHHVSAINEMEGLKIDGVRDVGESACELTWDWFNGDDVDMPDSVFLIGKYDTWRQDDEKHYGITYSFLSAKKFHEVHKYAPKGFPSEYLDLLLGYSVYDCAHDINNGGLLLNHMRDFYKSIHDTAFKTCIEFEDRIYKAMSINFNRGGSQVLSDAVCDEVEILHIFHFNGKNWKNSIYSNKDDVDCSKIAESFGGGGHRGAAGFVTEKTPFMI